MENSIHYKPIGYIRTPFTNIISMPIQPKGAKQIFGVITINEEYIEGLTDLDGFSHVILMYHFHLVKEHKLSVIPFMDDKAHGIFATRAPVRPNPIGMSIVRLKKIEQNLIYFD